MTTPQWGHNPLRAALNSAPPPPPPTVQRVTLDASALPESRLPPPPRPVIPQPVRPPVYSNPLFAAFSAVPVRTTAPQRQTLQEEKRAAIDLAVHGILAKPVQDRTPDERAALVLFGGTPLSAPVPAPHVSSKLASPSKTPQTIPVKTIRLVEPDYKIREHSGGKSKKRARFEPLEVEPVSKKPKKEEKEALPDNDVPEVESAPLPRRKPRADTAEEAALRLTLDQSSDGDPVSLQELLEMDKHDRALLLRLSWEHPGIGRAFCFYFDLRLVGLRENIKFYEYQKTALVWLYQREMADAVHGIRGGILNFDMGLGKTIMMLLHIFMRPRAQDAFPALAIMSNAVMLEWKTQLEKFFEPAFIKDRVLFMHRSLNPNIDRTSRADLVGKDLVITTYDALLVAFRKLPKTVLDECVEYISSEKRNKIAAIHCRPLMKADRPEWRGDLVFYGTPWDLVVRDESQRIANPTSKTFYSNMALYGRCKWLMTGTIVRNYLKDIFSQLRAIGYDGVEKTREWTLNKARECYRSHKLANVIYRLSYEDALVELPPMHDEPLYVTLNDTEKAIYAIIEKQAQDLYDRVLSKMAQYNDIRVMILRLRQECIAPWLLNARGALDEASSRPDIEEIEDDETDPESQRGTKRRRPAESSSSTRPKKRQRTKVDYEEPSSDDSEGESVGSSSDEVSSDGDDESSDSDDSAMSVESISSESSEPKEVVEDEEMAEADIDALLGIAPTIATPDEATEAAETKSLFDYCREMDGPGGIGASKIKAALAKIAEFFTGHPKRKLIVFSMFSSVLALVARALDVKQGRVVPENGYLLELWPPELRDFKTLTIDGSTVGMERADLIFAFRNEVTFRVALIQGKIGGEGLNLQEAAGDMEVTGMLIMEPHWTRQAKRQQKRRIHRIGQKHETYCWEIIVKDTIEDRVLELCDEKDKIELNFMHRQRGRPSAAKAGGLTMSNIGRMLGRKSGGPHQNFA